MKVLITGGSGFLGSRIFSAFSHTDTYTCIAPSHAELDITDQTQCLTFLQQWKPDIVIHTAAASDVNYCEAHPDSSYLINVLGPVHLAEACKAVQSKLIFMSSDQVYTANHTSVPNTESDICQPVPIYGKQKLEAEQRIQAILPDAISLRLSWMYDLPTKEFHTKPNFLTQILSAIENKQEIMYSNLEYRGITWVWEVIQHLPKAFTLSGGVYNFGSYATCTTYDLAKNVFLLLEKQQEADFLLKERDNVTPRSLAMTTATLESFGISFSENLEGIRNCLTHNHIIP